jgi:ATP-dependent helicase/nuclease subunit A
MTDAAPRWTTSQTLALSPADREILVTASAGTGKTAVLTERCLRILSDTSHPTSVDEILVVTFTDAAAEEMRSRIARGLRARYAKTPHPRLKHQLLLLDAADISTIHSFCKRLITDNFHRLAIDPAFRILEPDEQDLIRRSLLDEIVEQAWTDPSLAPALAQLLENRSVDTATHRFLDNIISISNFLDSLTSRQTFFDRAATLADIASHTTSQIADRQTDIILDKLKECLALLDYSCLLDKTLLPEPAFSDRICTNLKPVFESCIRLLNSGDLSTFTETVLTNQFPKFPNKPKDLSAETADLIKAPAKKAIETFKSLRDLALVNPEYERLVAQSSSLQTKVIIELVKRFDLAYARHKSRVNCLDFSDLQHLALRLLNENPDVAADLRRRFKYIFVDEYQDINDLQQAIIDKIASPRNAFFVGDIKQSIYGFRQSRPDIFLARLQTASPDPDRTDCPLRVDLADNFRSRKGILDFANLVFSRIMTSSVAHIDYDPSAYLTPGLEYQPASTDTDEPSAQTLVEMHLLDDTPDKDDNGAAEDSSDDDDTASTAQPTEFFDATQRQAAFVAHRIKQLLGLAPDSRPLQIYDKHTDSYRPIEYRDIVILMRSPAHRANQYIDILRLARIPVSTPASAGYFSTTEITDCLSLMKVLDNPRQDIPLAALLRSPFFNITDTQLALIASFHPDNEKPANLFDSLLAYSQSGPDDDLRQKLSAVLARLEDYRIIASRKGPADLLNRALADTDYIPFVLSLPNGKQRKANLEKLANRALQFASFSSFQTTSLSRFVEYIEMLLDRGADWAPAVPETSAENAVRIMSIHKSKGLEFPVVFLAELSTQFNTKDSSSDCLVDDSETIGIRIVEPTARIKLSSIAHQVIAEKKTALTLAEEMRLLYVAVTRAREKLILTASQPASGCASIVTQSSILADRPLQPWQLKSARSHLDWLLCALGNDPQLTALFDIRTDRPPHPDNLFTADIIDRPRLDTLSLSLVKTRTAPSHSPDKSPTPSPQTLQLLQKTRTSLLWQYPFADVTTITAKQSVSDLTHPEDEFAPADFSDSLDRLPAVLSAPAPHKPDSRAIGTATHLVIKSLDLTHPVTADSVKSATRQLLADGSLTPELADGIDIDSITAFFHSPLGLEVLTHARRLLREWPFTTAIDATLLGAHSTGETVIVQGIVDMIAPTPKGLIVIDFKTDKINPSQNRGQLPVSGKPENPENRGQLPVSVKPRTESAGNVIDFKTDKVDSSALDRRAALYTPQLTLYANAASAILKQPLLAAYLWFLNPKTPRKIL